MSQGESEHDRVVLTYETWEAFLQALGYAVASLDTRPANSAELLQRAALYSETHPLEDNSKQNDVRATHAFFAQIVRGSGQ